MTNKRFSLHLPIDEKDGTMGYIVDHCNKTTYFLRGENARKDVVNLLNNLHEENEKKDRIIKGQDAEISRQYNLCLAMSGILREEFGVYDVFDRSKDKRVK